LHAAVPRTRSDFAIGAGPLDCLERSRSSDFAQPVNTTIITTTHVVGIVRIEIKPDGLMLGDLDAGQDHGDVIDSALFVGAIDKPFDRTVQIGTGAHDMFQLIIGEHVGEPVGTH